jgi:hypothetical protein
VLGQFAAALKAERVATRQRQRLLVNVVVGFEANTAFKNGLHFSFIFRLAIN